MIGTAPAAITGEELATTLKRLCRDHIHTGFVSGYLNINGEMVIAIDNVDDLNAAAKDLRLHRMTMFADRWTGWYAEVHLTLHLEIPHGVITPRPRAAA